MRAEGFYRKRRFAAAVLITGFLFVFLLGCSKTASPPVTNNPDPKTAAEEVKPLKLTPWTGKSGSDWASFDKLVQEQKYEEASKIVEAKLKEAQTAGDSEEWVRCLIRYVQLRTALHGYETALRFLKEQPWPDDLLSQTVLNLYYGSALVTYAQVYSWEINQREKVESRGVVDLKAWTMEQIYAEALGAYLSVWKHRAELGEQPVTILQEYITPNNYPQEVRSTLRDAVSYFLVDLLSDSTGWRPEQSNEIFRLNLKALLGAMPAVSLADPAVHPLQKIAAVLDDLERWHQGRGELEAALEARLTRLRRLHDHFTDPGDRALIRKDLADRLPAYREKPWWSEGMAVLAEFTQEEDAPDNLVRARKIALEGKEAYPSSIGGRRCDAIIAAIEAPQYNLEGMSCDGAGKRSTGVRFKNLPELFFRAYPVDLKAQIETADDYNLLPGYDELRKLLQGATPTHEWRVELPATPDYKMHRLFVTPPMEKPGLYAVISSARVGFGPSDNVMMALDMVIGDLVLTARNQVDETEVVVLSGSSGLPVAGVEVFLYVYDYSQRRHHAVDSAVTGKDGTVHLKGSTGASYFLFARKGSEIVLDPKQLYFRNPSEAPERSATLIFTDRSIYRPQQKILWKAVAYRGSRDLADYRTSPETSLTISLVDGNHQVVENRTVKTNSYGTASGEFLIPGGRLLGVWQVRSSLGGQTNVRVEEYKRPTFEVKILKPESPLRLNKEAVLKGEVKYYFGLPVTEGQVKWRVTRSPVYPWWWSYYWWGGGMPARRAQTIESGTTSLADDGTFTVKFTPLADERLSETSKGITYSYTLTADVTDEGGETRSASLATRLGFVSVEASVETDREFFLEDVPPEMTLVRKDLDGTPAPGEGSYRVYALEGPEKTLLPADQPLPSPPVAKGAKPFETPDDRKRSRWEPNYSPMAVMREWADGDKKAAGDVQHDKEGKAALKLPELPPGAYRLRYETTDPYGAKYEMAKEFIVAGNTTPVPLPALLLVERHSVPVGETARILAHSGLPGELLYLDIYRDGKRVEQKTIESGEDPSLIEIPIGEGQRGGFGVTMWCVRDHQFMNLAETVMVPWDNKQLAVEFATFRDKLRPGAREKWTVKVKGPAGKDTAVATAELLAYMYDRSLDAFVPHNPPNPLSVFPTRTSYLSTQASLGPAPVQWVEAHGFRGLPSYPSLQEDALKFYSGYGIGGPGRRGWVAMPGVAGGAVAEENLQAAHAPMAKARAMSDVASIGYAKGDKAEMAMEVEGKPAEKQAEGGEAAPQPSVELRTDFSETAFFEPHLLTGSDGTASIEFTVPDSVTSWNVWVHAITNDFKSGFATKEAKSVKDLMVRPYLPRFLREGDRLELKVVVNNASKEDMTGQLTFEINDPDTGKDLLSEFGHKAAGAWKQPFTVPAGGGSNLTFPITVPARVGPIAVKVTAVSGSFSDGELRPLPVLPGRMHLAQSRFVTLKNRDRREMHFADLARNDDPTLINEQLVVTLDAQLFYSVLYALPYLVNYPYECTEQTLNRFLSTGILSSLYSDYPAIEKMVRKFKERRTQYERWDQEDPNRKMALEETPWLQMARGGERGMDELINVLDPDITRAERDSALAKLKKAQTASGGFPWFPGGPPSPYMTLYILYGFSKGLEFGVDAPQEVIQRGWEYMHRHYIDELVRDMRAEDCCWEFITFLNYVLGNYPDLSWTGGVFTEKDRQEMLAFSFRHWKQHSPYLKGYLSLTLKRMGRPDDAKLVWESVMDSAKTAPDQGTFWAPEDRAWLWYNDTVETHAFAIRTDMEVTPKDPKLDGLVLWLLLNKKLNHWKSTRATAEAIYSLAHYLKETDQLAVREEATVKIDDETRHFVFEPDEYTGKKNQIVIPGTEVDPVKTSTIVVEKETPGYLFASATWQFSTEKLPEEARGDYLSVKRTFFKRVTTGREPVLEPIKEGAVLRPGDELEVHLSITSKHPMEYVHLRDPRGAGFEPGIAVSRHKWDLGLYRYEEVRDSGMNFFFEHLPQGEYTLKHRIRAAIAGTFKIAPATLQPMYAPEFAAYSSGAVLTIEGAEKAGK